MAEDEWQVRFDCAQTEIVFLRKRLAQLEERLEAELGTRTALEQKASAASPGGDRDPKGAGLFLELVVLSLLPGALQGRGSALHLLLVAAPTDQGKPDIFYWFELQKPLLRSKIPPWSSVSVGRGWGAVGRGFSVVGLGAALPLGSVQGSAPPICHTKSCWWKELAAPELWPEEGKSQRASLSSAWEPGQPPIRIKQRNKDFSWYIK